jgi:hypothetical protein
LPFVDDGEAIWKFFTHIYIKNSIKVIILFAVVVVGSVHTSVNVTALKQVQLVDDRKKREREKEYISTLPCCPRLIITHSSGLFKDFFSNRNSMQLTGKMKLSCYVNPFQKSMINFTVIRI